MGLRKEYVELQNRFDSLNMVLNNIEKRDENIFNIMFESSPYRLESSKNEQLLNSHELSLNLPTDQLLKIFDKRCNDLSDSTQRLVESTHSMLINIKDQGKHGRNIPAIQPIANRQLTLLTASYGMRINPFHKRIQPHLGVDYTVPEGTRVFATADGKIKEYTLISAPSGKSITIDHGNGYETYYSHLDKIDIPRSRRVKRGEIIGMSGNTGLSLTPHLHYEVRYKGEKINPINYFFMELTPSETQRLNKIAQSGMQAFD